MSIKIVINNPKETYNAGTSIFGKVICNLDSPDLIDVKIKLVGEEYTFVMGTTEIGRTSKFLETKYTILKTGRLGPDDENKFCFTLILPRYIPSTYEGKHGCVKFFLVARMDVRWQHIYEDELELTVFSPIDLNTMRTQLTAAELPGVHTDEIVQSKGLWCIPDVVKMDVKMYDKLFAVNEVVPVEVTIQCGSRKLTCVKTKLCVAVQAKLLGPIPAITSEVMASKRDDFVEFERERILNYQINMMRTATLPNFDKCTLFKQWAFLRVAAFFDYSVVPEVMVEVKLILGHIPVNRNNIGLQRERESVEDVAIIRKISKESTGYVNIRNPLPSTSCTSLRGNTSQCQNSPFHQRLPREASSRSTPDIPSTPPPSYASIMSDHIGFRLPLSNFGRELPGPSFRSSQPNISPSAPPDIAPSAPIDEEVVDHTHLFRTAHISSETPPEEGLELQVPKLPTPNDEVGLPPTYEATLSMSKKEERREFAS